MEEKKDVMISILIKGSFGSDGVSASESETETSSKTSRSFNLERILCDFFIFTLEQIIPGDYCLK